MQKITKVCWNITNSCNEECPFCFRETKRAPLSIDKNIMIINNLIQYGIKSISFSGGEPLLHNGIIYLIKYSHTLGLETNLITNCISLNAEILSDLEGYLDWITFPLDSVNENIQTKMGRNINHIHNVTKNLEYIQQENMSFKIKINTVLCKINHLYINELYDFAKSNRNIMRWKIFRFTALRGSSIKNENKFEIDDNEYNKIIGFIKLSNGGSGLRVNIDSSYSLRNSYIVIAPDGCVMKWDDSLQEEYAIGDLNTMSFEQIFRNNEFDYELYNMRSDKNLNIAIV